MKKRQIACMLTLFSALGLLGGCTGLGHPDQWSFVGTWQNAAYDGMNGHGGGPAKIVYDDSGSVSEYLNAADASPMMTGTYSMVSDWVQMGMHWFKIQWTLSGSNIYFLVELYDDPNYSDYTYGNIIEVSASVDSFPTAISPSNGYYGIYYRP